MPDGNMQSLVHSGGNALSLGEPRDFTSTLRQPLGQPARLLLGWMYLFMGHSPVMKPFSTILLSYSPRAQPPKVLNADCSSSSSTRTSLLPGWKSAIVRLLTVSESKSATQRTIHIKKRVRRPCRSQIISTWWPAGFVLLMKYGLMAHRRACIRTEFRSAAQEYLAYLSSVMPIL